MVVMVRWLYHGVVELETYLWKGGLNNEVVFISHLSLSEVSLNTWQSGTAKCSHTWLLTVLS